MLSAVGGGRRYTEDRHDLSFQTRLTPDAVPDVVTRPSLVLADTPTYYKEQISISLSRYRIESQTSCYRLW
jgi:hypothetical protein